MNDDVLAHLVLALTGHRKWCRSRGHPFPPLLDTILNALTANNGPQRPEIATPLPDGHPKNVVTPKLINDEAAATLLGISPRTVRRLRTSGKIPQVKVGHRRLIRIDDIEAYVKRNG